MSEILKAILDMAQNDSVFYGVPWPDEATHAVRYNTSTWPLGWGNESRVEFFRSEEGWKQWKSRMAEWSKCEDNHVAYEAYMWDLGPCLVAGQNEDQLPYTYQEKEGTFKTVSVFVVAALVEMGLNVKYDKGLGFVEWVSSSGRRDQLWLRGKSMDTAKAMVEAVRSKK